MHSSATGATKMTKMPRLNIRPPQKGHRLYENNIHRKELAIQYFLK